MNTGGSCTLLPWERQREPGTAINAPSNDRCRRRGKPLVIKEVLYRFPSPLVPPVSASRPKRPFFSMVIPIPLLHLDLPGFGPPDPDVAFFLRKKIVDREKIPCRNNFLFCPDRPIRIVSGRHPRNDTSRRWRSHEPYHIQIQLKKPLRYKSKLETGIWPFEI